MKKLLVLGICAVAALVVAVVAGVSKGSGLSPVVKRPMGIVGVSRRYSALIARAEADGWLIED